MDLRYRKMGALPLPVMRASILSSFVRRRRTRCEESKEFRAGAGNRTPDLFITSEPLCRLSYSGLWRLRRQRERRGPAEKRYRLRTESAELFAFRTGRTTFSNKASSLNFARLRLIVLTLEYATHQAERETEMPSRTRGDDGDLGPESPWWG